MKQIVSDAETGTIIAVEECINGIWTWYYNQMDGNRLERYEGKGRVKSDLPLNYKPMK